jgi:hypothetical protein
MSLERRCGIFCLRQTASRLRRRPGNRTSVRVRRIRSGFTSANTVPRSQSTATLCFRQSVPDYEGVAIPKDPRRTREDRARCYFDIDGRNTSTYNVAPFYTFVGYLSPVANQPAINVIHVAQVVSLKWRLPDDAGGYVHDLPAFNALLVQSITCPSATGNVINVSASGPSGLSYDAANNAFVYNWRPSGNSRGCQRVIVTLRDGSRHDVDFQIQ